MRLDEIKISLPKVSNNFVNNICMEFLKGKKKQPSMDAYSCDPNNQKVEVRRLAVSSRPAWGYGIRPCFNSKQERTAKFFKKHS